MKKSSLLGHTIQILDIVRSSRRPADRIAGEFFRAHRYLGSSDRRYISGMLYGVLRNMTLLEVHAAGALGGIFSEARSVPLLPSVVLCAAYALRILGETPEELLPDISGLWRLSVPDADCNLFLTVVQKSSLPDDILRDPIRRIAVEQSFPESIVREWAERYGPEETERLCRSLNEPAPTAIRVNTTRCTLDECRALLGQEGVVTRPSAIAPLGLLLEKRVNVQALQAFRRGFFEIQDEGSQTIPLLLEPRPGACIVDACAGGGGKTLHIAALMENRGELYAIDTEERRLSNIRERIDRSGTSIVTVLLADRDGSKIEGLRGKADAVLVDAPCTGVGTYRRNPGAKLSFSRDFVDAISQTQQDVLQRYSSLVKDGGRLVYATCSLLRKENEEVVASFLDRNPDFRLLPAGTMSMLHGITSDDASGYLYLLPHKTSTDGFFAAVMTRQTANAR